MDALPLEVCESHVDGRLVLLLQLPQRRQHVCLIDLILYVPVNTFAFMLGCVFLG